jgi:hypothetical protein
MSQKGPFLIPHFALLLNFPAPVAIIDLVRIHENEAEQGNASPCQI